MRVLGEEMGSQSGGKRRILEGEGTGGSTGREGVWRGVAGRGGEGEEKGGGGGGTRWVEKARGEG